MLKYFLDFSFYQKFKAYLINFIYIIKNNIIYLGRGEEKYKKTFIKIFSQKVVLIKITSRFFFKTKS